MQRRHAVAERNVGIAALGEQRAHPIEIARPRYVGARIGIHNLKGEKVGKVGRLRNVEHLFVATERPVALPAAA